MPFLRFLHLLLGCRIVLSPCLRRGIVSIPKNVPLLTLVPKGAGRTKLLSNMTLKHRLQNSILLKLLVLQMLHWLLPFLGLLPSLLLCTSGKGQCSPSLKLTRQLDCLLLYGHLLPQSKVGSSFAVVQGVAQCSTGVASQKQNEYFIINNFYKEAQADATHLHKLNTIVNLLDFYDAFQSPWGGGAVLVCDPPPPTPPPGF